MNKLTSIIGIIATIFSLIFVFIGLSSQLLKNYRLKSVKGLAFISFLFSFLVFFSWFIYGILKKDFYLIISQGAGTVIALLILFQFWIYRK